MRDSRIFSVLVHFYLKDNPVCDIHRQGVLKLKHQAMADDTRPIDPTCDCMVCFDT